MTTERLVDRKEDLQFKHPFNAFIAGPSQCGKTTVLRQILENHSQTIAGIESKIIKVAWCYGKWQKYYEIPLKNVEFKYIDGCPEEDDVFGYDIIVFDDLIQKIEKCPYLAHLFTAGTHHDNQSVVVLTQNYYQKGPIADTLRKNSHYVMLFKDPGDKTIARTMSWRMYPKNFDYMLDAFEQATSQPHGYLLIDRTQNTSDDYRLRSNIVPNKDTGYKLKPHGWEKI